MNSTRDARVSFQPIGVVHREEMAGDRETAISQIELRPDLLPALEGLEEFSHILVIFHLHQSPADSFPLHVHPEGRPELPLVGVLATRSPRRPNPIAVTVVELLRREEHVLTVRGLDALDGTPVLDLKPYMPRGDRVEKARTPRWVERLWAIHDEEHRHG